MSQLKDPAQGRLTIAAGPVYVEFQTGATHTPSSDTHTELFPAGTSEKTATAPRWKREVGGSVWKAALSSRSSQEGAQKRAASRRSDKFVLVSRFARERSPSGRGYDQHPFVDDAKWLKEQIRQFVGGDADRKTGPVSEDLEVVFRSASSKALPDYTFHMEHPTWHPSPILTVRGGAARELTWDDVVTEWKSNWRDGKTPFRETIVFLTGVLRTRLLETLADAIRNKQPETVGRYGLLNRARLVIDFGRTLRRDSRRSSEDPELFEAFEAFRRNVQLCVQNADIVLADEHTATEFGLREARSLPKHRLVIRRVTTSSEMWWQFRRGEVEEGGTASVECGHFPAPEATGIRDQDTRPALDLRLARRLLRREKRTEPKSWQRYVDPFAPQSPEDITDLPQLQDELRALEALVQRNAISTLFIYGETGTGKEIIANWIHRIHPHYSSGEFRAVSCGRQRGELVQSELFGHVVGAFTGATEARKGAFLQADGGVLILDDLDTLDETTQAMLLRVIETGLVRPVGADVETPVDVFLIVTTNVDPEELLRRTKGPRLREDLYFRLQLHGEFLFLPPLRQPGRKEEIRDFIKRQWRTMNERFGTDFPVPTALASAALKSPLRGNYRILIACINTTYRAVLARTKPGTKLRASEMSLPQRVAELLQAAPPNGTSADAKRPRKNPELFDWLRDNQSKASLQGIRNPTDRLKRFCDLWREWCNERIEMGFEADQCSRLYSSDIRELLGLSRQQFKGAAANLHKDGVLPRVEVPEGTNRNSHFCVLIGVDPEQ